MSGMRFQELVEECLKVTYEPVEDKTEWDYIRESIYLALHNEIQLKTLFILVKMFYPLKLITKILLKDYARNGSCHNIG